MREKWTNRGGAGLAWTGRKEEKHEKEEKERNAVDIKIWKRVRERERERERDRQKDTERKGRIEWEKARENIYILYIFFLEKAHSFN